MQLAAIIHDVYDDPNGMILVRDHVRSSLHEKVASLSLLPQEALAALPDRVFALVATADGVPLRKYAMHDEAHLRASVLYFEEAGAGYLPLAAAVKVAQNLLVGCDWYDVTPSDDLVKLAGLANVLTGTLGAADMVGRASEVPGHVRAGNNLMRTAQMAGKKASVEIQYTEQEIARLMGSTEPTTEDTILRTATSINGGKTKKADIPAHVMPRGGSNPTVPTSTTATTERTTAKVSALGELSAYASVSTTPEVKIAASLSAGSYPLDTSEEVKAAAAWLQDNLSELDIHDRRALAQSIDIRAEEIGTKVASPLLRQYAGDTFGDFLALEVAGRVSSFEDTVFEDAYRTCQAKLSSASPAEMVKELLDLDMRSGVHLSWNREFGGFRDPYRAVYEKEAADHGQYTWTSGTDYTSAMLLERLAQEYPLEKVIDEDLAKSFRKDPVGIFKSLPDPEKKVLARLSGQQHSGMI